MQPMVNMLLKREFNIELVHQIMSNSNKNSIIYKLSIIYINKNQTQKINTNSWWEE